MKKLSILLISLLLLCSCSIQKEEKVAKEDKFALEYSIDENHKFKSSKVHDIFDILDSGTGIIYFANSDDEKSIIYTDVINDIFNDLDIDKINYYNPSTVKNNNTKYYRELLNLVGDYSIVDENNNPSLDIPSLYFVKDGNIVSYLNTANYNIDSLMKKKTKKKIKNEIKESLEKYKSA